MSCQKQIVKHPCHFISDCNRVTQKFIMSTSIWVLSASWSLHDLTRAGQYHSDHLLCSFEFGILFLKRCEQSQGPGCFHVITQLKFLFHSGGFHQSRASIQRCCHQDKIHAQEGSKFNLNSVISARGSSIVCHRIFSYVMTGWVSLISWSLLEFLVCWKNFFPFRILAECLKNGLLVSLIFSWKKSFVSLGAVSIITSLSF